MNKTKSTLLIVAIIILVIIVIGRPFYVVPEGRQAVITQFGDPVGGPINQAGLKVKVPFIQKVNMFEKRILEWDGDPTQIPTKDKKYIWVDTTARWKITNPLLFLQSVRTESGAHSRLDDIIDAAVRDIVASHKLTAIVRSSNRIIDTLEAMGERKKQFVEESALERITVGRDRIRKEILKSAKELAPNYGIAIIDVRIKRVNYIEQVQTKVFERMIAERKRAAEEYRSEGRGVKNRISGKTDRELKSIISSAYKKAQKIKGEADAKATEIYAQAYEQDSQFYSFLKALETYEDSINKDTILILPTDSDYLKYLDQKKPALD
jgi:membrane protease subunit HflC